MTNGKCWTAALCLGIATLLGGGRLWAVDPERQQMDEVRTRMKAAGWTEISEGVFERHRGATKVEHLGYGREGLIWHVGELTRQLENLMLEYETYPSDDLARIIDNLSVTIAKAKREIKNMPEGLSSATAALSGASCSNICYSATADAYYLTNVQGVGAVADAKFNSTCGYSGETYAYAWGRATKNGVTTTTEQEDPDAGTSASSHAEVTVEGKSVSGVPCGSSANSYAQSTALGISYSTSDTNSFCPPPFQISINSGPDSVTFSTATCSTQTWGATASGGISPYSTFKWYVNGVQTSTGSTYSRSVCYNHADFTLEVKATDANGTPAADTRTIDVINNANPPSVAITGTTSESFNLANCRTKTWSATITGGATPYTYQWKYNGTNVGTGSTYSRSICYDDASFRLDLTVTDGNGSVGTDPNGHTVTVVDNSGGGCPTCSTTGHH